MAFHGAGGALRTVEYEQTLAGCGGDYSLELKTVLSLSRQSLFERVGVGHVPLDDGRSLVL
jgi:hypothetical protein